MTKPQIHLILSDARGVYIPRDFATDFLDLRAWRGVSREDKAVLLSGPDHSDYWETWTEVEQNAEHRKTGATLYQDGDLWLIEPGAVCSPEDLDDIADSAFEAFSEAAKPYLADGTANLFDGPDTAEFSFEECIEKTREALDSATESATIPDYMWSDFGGFCETDFDIEAAIISRLGDRAKRFVSEYVQ